jgi:murein L,D-transpeptidase YafK
MIHGLPNGLSWVASWHRKMDWTDGCIAVTNEEMDEIWRAVPDGTPIEINP